MNFTDHTGFQSIAFPLIQSGPFSFPVDELALAFSQVLKEFQHLKEVRIVGSDISSLKILEGEMKKLKLMDV